MNEATKKMMQHHQELRAQNDRVVRTGMAMENHLKPIENGLRIETERRAAKEAAGRTRLDGDVEEEPENDDGVKTVR